MNQALGQEGTSCECVGHAWLANEAELGPNQWNQTKEATGGAATGTYGGMHIA